MWHQRECVFEIPAEWYCDMYRETTRKGRISDDMHEARRDVE